MKQLVNEPFRFEHLEVAQNMKTASSVLDNEATFLANTRKLNRLNFSAGAGTAAFAQIGEVLNEALGAQVWLLDTKDQALVQVGTSEEQVPVASLHMAANYAARFVVTAPGNAQVLPPEVSPLPSGNLLGVSLTVEGNNLGTLLVGLEAEQPAPLALVLIETAASVAASRLQAAGPAAEAERAASLKVALGNISYSEMLALQGIFSSLEGNEGTVVSSRIADQMGITRSVFVNALSKLSSAGLIEARSMGMKGTRVKVLHPDLAAAVSNWK